MNVQTDVAVSFNEYAGAENLLPCAEQETERLYQEVTDINQEVEKE